jgi:hypothetical protein
MTSKRPIDIADSGFVRLQILNHDLPETIWHIGVLDQFRCGHPLSTAVAGRASLRVRENTPSEQSGASSASVPFDQRTDRNFKSSSSYMVEAVVTAYE